MNTNQVELALAKGLGWRRRLIIPNVSFGFGVHECDLLCVSRNGYATEIEIKVSAADLKQDAKKWHQHRSRKIKYLYFAIPEALLSHIADVPEGAGIIVVYDKGPWKIHREPRPNKCAEKVSMEDRLHLAELGTMRMWNMKAKAIEEEAMAKREARMGDAADSRPLEV